MKTNSILTVVILGLFSVLMVTCISCKSAPEASSDKSQQVISNAEKILGPAAVQFLAAEAKYAVTNGGKVSGEQAIQAAAQSLWTNINNVNSPQDAKTLTVQAGAAVTSDVVASVFAHAATSDPRAATNAIAAVLSTMAGAPPAPETVK